MSSTPGDGERRRLLDIGRIARPHGLRGEVVVQLTTDRLERLAPGSVLHSDLGELVVVTARGAHRDRWIVAFAGHEDRETVEPLRGLVLRAEALDEAEELWVHELVGTAVTTPDGARLGTCVAVVANPAADLIELEDGTLVPVVFVVHQEPGRVVVDPPEGLLDL